MHVAARGMLKLSLQWPAPVGVEAWCACDASKPQRLTTGALLQLQPVFESHQRVFLPHAAIAHDPV